MKLRKPRAVILGRVLLALLGSAVAWSCGSDSTTKSPGGSGAQGGDAGEATFASAGNLAIQGGQAGARDEPESGGRAGEPEAPSSAAGAAGSGPLGEAGGTTGGAGDTTGGAGGAGGSEPVIDVGEGCIAPAKAAPLSAAAAGLPETGLRLWLRADRGVYATAEHRVCAWADQSEGRHLFLATGDNRPLWAAASLGTQAAISFDKTASYLAVSGVLGIEAQSARTFIAVVQLVNTTDRFAAVQQGASGTPGTYVNLDANTFQTAGSREGVYVLNNSYDSGLATSTAPRVHLLSIGSMTPATPILGAIDYRVNGVAQTLTRNYGGLGDGNFESFSNANYTLVGGGVSAFIAEALIYDRALSTDERLGVEAALSARYEL